MKKYRRKPTYKYAEQWFPGKEIEGVHGPEEFTKRYYVITIHEEKAYLQPGDYVVKEPDGIHHYPCKAEIFENDHELVKD